MTAHKFSTQLPLIGAFLYAFIAAVCINMMGMSTPMISAVYQVDQSSVTYVTTVYLLAEIFSLGFFPYLYQKLSPQTMLQYAGGGFLLTTALCSFSPTFASLCFFRFAQGLFGGILIPLANTLIQEWSSNDDQKEFHFLFGVIMSISPVAGIVWGGAVGDISMVLLFSFPMLIGFFAFFCARQSPPANLVWTNKEKTPFPVSILFFSLGLLILGDAIERGKDLGYGYSSFWRFELYCCATIIVSSSYYLWFRPNTQLRLNLLRDHQIMFICFLSFLIGVVVYGFIFAVPYYFFLAHLYQASDLVYIMLVTSGLQLALSPFFKKIFTLFSAQAVTVVCFFGLSIAAFLCANLQYQSHWTDAFASQVIRAVFTSPLVLSLAFVLIEKMPKGEITHGQTIYSLCRLLGGAVGIAAFVSIVDYYSRLNGSIYQESPIWTPEWDQSIIQTLAVDDAFSFTFQCLGLGLLGVALLSYYQFYRKHQLT